MDETDTFNDLSPVEKLRKCREDIKKWRSKLKKTYFREAVLLVFPALVTVINGFSIWSLWESDTQWAIAPIIIFLLAYLYFTFNKSLPTVYREREKLKELLGLYDQLKRRIEIEVKLMELGLIDHSADELDYENGRER